MTGIIISSIVVNEIDYFFQVNGGSWICTVIELKAELGGKSRCWLSAKSVLKNIMLMNER